MNIRNDGPALSTRSTLENLAVDVATTTVHYNSALKRLAAIDAYTEERAWTVADQSVDIAFDRMLKAEKALLEYARS